MARVVDSKRVDPSVSSNPKNRAVGLKLSEGMEISEERTSRMADHSARADRRAEAKRAFDAMMTMKKIDVAKIEAARRG